MFKIGDVVECVNGSTPCGVGFTLGRTFIVTRITYSDHRRQDILWGDERVGGVFESQVILKVADGLLR